MQNTGSSTADPMTLHRHVMFLKSIDRSPLPAFVTPGLIQSWHDWTNAVDRMTDEFRPLSRARVGIVVHPTGNSYALFISLLSLNCDVFVLDAAAPAQTIAELADSCHVDTILDPISEDDPSEIRRNDCQPAFSQSGRGDVTLFTSGSTGRPKPICHTWESLTRPVRQNKKRAPLSWLLTYRPHLYAGLQVFVHCLLNQETLVMPNDGMAVDALLDLMCRHHVTSVSATPSYWRRLLALGQRDSLRKVPLEQITLGGETADQSVLSALALTYPEARLVHIYATSELGRCFSVKDGMAGFSASLLDRATEDGVELKVVDGELHVRSANAAPRPTATDDRAATHTDWLGTGDLVERAGDRYHFAGRLSDVINVGGNKVNPLRVEQLIQTVPGVRDARVFAKHSSMVGEMVACEFVAEPGFDSREVLEAIQRTCRERLTATERPRLVRATESITLSAAGKKIRGRAE